MNSLLRLLLPLLLAAAALPAQEEPALPLPDRLSQDWWTSYFEPSEPLGEEVLAERIDTFQQALAQQIETFPPEQRELFESLANRLSAVLQRYTTLRATAPPVPAPAQSLAESYTVDEALDRYAAWKQLDLEVQAEREEGDWQQSLLDPARRQQTSRRLEYLETKPGNPDRFALGLNLMLTRVETEARALEVAQAESEVERSRLGLASIGLDLTKFALFASALGVGLGFGLQNLVSNFVAGLIILFEKSLNVGDFVELQSGVTGEVREINMRSTLIMTNDNIDILVPNSEFVSGQVTNWTLREAYRRIHIPFGVAYGTNKDLVKQAGLEAAERVPWTLKGQTRRKPQVWFVGFGESSLDFELVVWLTPEAVKRPSAVQAYFLWGIDTSLRKAAIEVPFPQRDLHLRTGFERL